VPGPPPLSLLLAAVRTVRFPDGVVFSAAATLDGRILVGGRDKAVRVLSLATGEMEARLTGHTGWVRVLCPLRDGSNRLLSGSNTGSIRLHDLSAARGGATVPAVREYRGPNNYVRNIVELRGGRFASVAGLVSEIRVLDMRTDVVVATLRGHKQWICCLATTLADDDTLVSGGWDKTVRVWDTRTYAAVAVIETPYDVYTLTVLADGTIASGHSDDVVRLWDAHSHEGIGKLEDPACRLASPVQLADGRLACVASWPLIAADGTSKWSWSLQVWDVAAPTCVSSTPFDFPVRLCCGTADGELVVYNESVVMLFACAWERRCAAVMGWAARCAGVWA